MQDKDKIIAQPNSGYSPTTEDGYTRLEMLMRGNEQEHQEDEKIKMWTLAVIGVIFIVLAFYQSRINRNTNIYMMQSIEDYVQQTYGSRFDRFQRQEINSYTLQGANETISQRFVENETGYSFYISADADGNITFDGYQETYLTGESVFNHYETLYWKKYRSVDSYFYKYATENGYMTMLDNCSISFDFTDGSSYIIGDKYTGPYLDPSVSHDFARLAKEYGYISLRRQMAEGTPQSFINVTTAFHCYLAENDIPYNYVIIGMEPKSGDIRYVSSQLTAEELAWADYLSVMAQNAEITADFMHDDAVDRFRTELNNILNKG